MEPSSQQSGFHGGYAKPEGLGRLFGREVFDVAEREDGAKAGRQPLDGLAEDVAELGLAEDLLGIRAPLGEVARDGALLGLDVLVHGDGLAGLAFAQAHEALVDGDADEPGGELRVSLELVELFVGLEKGVLGDVFGVFAILRDVLGDPEDLPFVLADELLEGGTYLLPWRERQAQRQGESRPLLEIGWWA